MTPLAKLLEAALFASSRPIPSAALGELDAEATPAAIAAALDEIREHYDTEGHGVELVAVGDGWQILTRPEYTEAIERAQLAARPQRLSGAALETLAIIAYASRSDEWRSKTFAVSARARFSSRCRSAD